MKLQMHEQTDRMLKMKKMYVQSKLETYNGNYK